MELLPDQHTLQHVLQTVSNNPFRLRLGDWLVVFVLASIGVFYAGDGKLWGKPDPNKYLWYQAPQKTGDLKARPKPTRDIGKRLAETGNDIAVFWGSQSGVSEAFAERLSREWQSRFALKTLVADLQDYDPEHLAMFPKDKLAVFLVSTYGEGDPPDNATQFCLGLEKMKKNETSLEDLRYLAIGMGNRNYQYYNRTITVIDDILSNLGAKRIGSLGRADESQGTTEEDFMDWKEQVLKPLGQTISLDERPIAYQPTIHVLDVCVDEPTIYMGEPSERALQQTTERVAYNDRNPFAAPIATSKILSSASNRICAHMEFDLSAAPSIRYQTGDHLAIWPLNPENEVARLCRALGLDEDVRKKPIMVESKQGKCDLPSPTTRETLLKYYLEIGALASRDLLILIAQFAPSEEASAALLGLGKNKHAFRNQVASQYLTVGKVLESINSSAGSWSKIPFSLLVESFSRIQPRYYSISSSPIASPRQPTITLAVNSKQLENLDGAKNEERFHGLATNFLLAHDREFRSTSENPISSHESEITDISSGPKYDLAGPRGKLLGGRVYMHIKRSTFKLPIRETVPIVMVAAGTGIAPFRGFVQERARLVELGKPVGKMVLFFGCRDDKTDFLYRDEWKAWKETLGDSFQLVTAFSRQKEQDKVYVQDMLAEDRWRFEVGTLVEDERAAFYICGAASMAREVRSRLVDILAEKRGVSREEADKTVGGKMKKESRYQEDVWG
ncbi:riboflavin synthase domain-like protein [Lophium mytilinum]|uniref:NADPH--hemoprotein reductase n=1 Tax=Lophium mytilinum TaxID=390894 RepID=A0A6A6Q9G6_9PEZI|nr:riboflavin synthase domain-like protein [Lophium mytilinum]